MEMECRTSSFHFKGNLRENRKRIPIPLSLTYVYDSNATLSRSVIRLFPMVTVN